MLLLNAYHVQAVGRVDEAENALRTGNFDLALLDVAAGGEHSTALRFIRSLRTAGERLPIIATSAVPGPDVAVAALRAGSDDFVRKPWRSEELVARIDRHIERQLERAAPGAEKAGGVYLHEDFRFGRAQVGADLSLRLESMRIPLLAKQYAILWFFRKNRGKLVTREALRREIWGPATNAGLSSMTEYISRLRKAFRSLGIDFDELVHTQSGAGYHVSDKIDDADGQ